jgi:PAS domain S-box-containing protein
MVEEPRRRAGRDQPDHGTSTVTAESELNKLRSEAAFHQRLRDLTVAFSRGVSSTLNLGTALQTLAFDVNSLLGASRTAVWLHDRRARQLELAGSSDPDRVAEAERVATDDSASPASRGLRLDGPALFLDTRSPLLLAPLRGWRRALGTLVVEGPFSVELDPAQLVQLTHELSRQLSAAIENIQLIEELLRQRRLLEDTFNSIVDLVVVTDNQLRVVQMNEAFIARAAMARAELLERNLDSLVGEELAAWATATSHDTHEATPDSGDGVRTRHVEDPRLGGTLAVTMTPLINQGGDPAGHVLVARDITDQMRLEKEREALRERLAQSEKLASLGQFVAGIAHEMNNPLQGVLGHLELMIETVEEARPLRRELRRIYHEADRAAKIVRNLMVFTGARRMARRRLRLDRLITRALGSRSAALRRSGIEVVREDAASIPAVIGDPLLLHQAFLNILVNAEHAIAARGGEGRVHVRCFADPARHQVTATIRDTGPGIPPEILPRIFDPFFTTKEVGQGTGLGLAITYGIVQEHGGTIHAANADEGGAIFTIDLPIAR